TSIYTLSLHDALPIYRLFLLADYYRTITSDLLLNVGISAVSGFQTTLQNIGEVKNEGFEIALKSRNLVGEFSWETDFNFSTNKRSEEHTSELQSRENL